MKRRSWLTTEEALMREKYPTLGRKKMAELLGRCSRSVQAKAVRMGLVRPRKTAWEQVIIRCAAPDASVVSVTRSINTVHVQQNTGVWRTESWVKENLRRERAKKGGLK